MPDDAPYTCWASHAEDLTEQVKQVVAELKAGQRIGTLGLLSASSPAEQAVTVTCSQGHDNVFTVAIS